MLVGMVDTIFADVAQPDQARIVSLNAHHFLKNGGHFVISIKVKLLCITSTNVRLITIDILLLNEELISIRSTNY